MINTVQKVLNRILSDHPPGNILCVGHTFQDLISEFTAAHPHCRISEVKLSNLTSAHCNFSAAISQLAGCHVFDFGIVANTIEHMDRPCADHLLARLRDMHTKRLLVIVPIGNLWENHQSHWQEADLLALGFIVKAKIQVEQKPVHVYAFDIASYKTTPDWLNSKYWANPELWGKYWW
jgi:hypothetical protein